MEEIKTMKNCPRCGRDLSFFNTSRYFESGEAVCDCRGCGHRLSTSADWKKEKSKDKK